MKLLGIVALAFGTLMLVGVSPSQTGFRRPRRLDELTSNRNRLNVVIPVRFLHRLIQPLLSSLNPC